MKPGKQKPNIKGALQRRHDLCCKVHDPAQFFVLPSYTMHDLRNQHVSIG